MKKPRALFYLSLTRDLKSYFSSKVGFLSYKIIPDVLTKETLDPTTEILGVFADSRVTKSVMNKLPHLKLIVTFSTGFDHIDLKEARRRKIPVCNVPTYGEYTVAQHTLTLILALSKKLFESVKRVKEGRYDYHDMRGFDLEGKTIGIVGTGHIGKKLITMLDGFNTTILAYDPYPDKAFAESKGYTYVPLNTLFKTADIITLHVPLLPETKHLIDKKAIKKMKRGVYIINTARGGLIDPTALLEALQNGQIAGAGLDVLEEEEIMQDPFKIFCDDCEIETIKNSLMNAMIIDHPKTIVTPHNAFNTTEAITRILDTTVDNIKAYLKGHMQNDVALKK